MIEFQTLTKESLVCHIFLEEADFEMQKIATQLLAKNPEGNLDELRTQVKPQKVQTGTNQEQKSELAKQDRMEEQEDGAQIVRVEHIALPSVSENVLFAKALDIKHLSAETKLRQDHLM